MTKYIAVLSTGQIVQPDIRASISSFASLAAKYNCLPSFITYPFYYATIALRYSYDLYFGHYIDKYKRGEMTTDQFINEFLRTQITTSATPEELKQSWNTMCQMNENSKTYFVNKVIASLQNEPNLVVCLPSATNELQDIFVRDQFKKISEDFQNFVDKGRIIFSPSYTQGTLLLLRLVNTALQNFNVAGNVIASIHNRIPSAKLEAKNARIFDAKFDPAKELISYFERTSSYQHVTA
jgi:hypothetical protein